MNWVWQFRQSLWHSSMIEANLLTRIEKEICDVLCDMTLPC